MMAALQFLSLDKDELAALQRLGSVVLANYRNEPINVVEPSRQEFEVLAAVFSRVAEMSIVDD
jgi:hypothetical protein